MFGFIASPCARCTQADFPVWRGTFCGLARTLARDYSAPARLLVNRDATFLALLGLSVDPNPPAWKRATCCNPLATPFPVDDRHPAVAHAAAVSICGLAAKLDDDALDEGPIRRRVAGLSSALVSPATGRAIGHLNSSAFPTAEVLGHLAGQESRELHSPLDADQPTARAFGLITAHLARLLGMPALRPGLLELGEAHGRLVYWRDARDDRAVDLRKGRFNPFAHACPDAIARRITASWETFTTRLSSLPFTRHRELLTNLGDTTAARHASFLATADAPPETRKKRRKEKDSNRCCDCGDCCCCPSCGGRSSGGASHGCCDKCFDCGPGDSGCIDCCPCDGCDCGC